MKKILGLDLGTNSVGWALIEKPEHENEEGGNILGMGSRIIPMGTDKLDYEKGIGVTKNADRRIARTTRKMNKRYKIRRNKLLFILNELGMLPNQFRFRYKLRDEKGRLTGSYEYGLPPAKNLQDLELLPIEKGTLQLNSLQHYKLRASSISNSVTLKEFGKILYQFNQLRGYAGGNNDEDSRDKKNREDEEDIEKKKYEVINEKVKILKVGRTDKTFKIKGGRNKGQELFIYDVTILLDDEEKEGTTILQSLEVGKEEELEIRIKRTKKGESIVFALPQKTNWRKQMEATEEILKSDNLFIGQLLLRDLEQNNWAKIRNRVVLRYQYQKEFDKIWDEQARHYSILNNCPIEKLESIVNYLYPGIKQGQINLRTEGIGKGLKHIIRNQVIFYQRPLKSQKELISKCRFEKEEKVLPNSHPLFQEFRCWDQINRMFITSKVEAFDKKKNKTVYKYYDKYLTAEQKQEIYIMLHEQKQVGFSEVARIVELKNDKTEYLNGLNAKAKLKGCDTLLTIKKFLGDNYDLMIKKEINVIEKIWDAIYNNAGNEYDAKSPKVSAIINVLHSFITKNIAIELALKLAQNIKYPRNYSSLSAKAINNILPLMVCNVSNLPIKAKERFEKIKYIIDTGEITDDDFVEPYMIDYIYNNPNIIKTGGMMFAFASSLIYGKHTAETVKPSITNYHKIQYDKDRKLRNPIVEQIINETMQVIKAIWKQYKFNPNELEIRVELARELKNSAAEREKIYKGQLKNQRENDRIKTRLEEEKITITEENILKYKLYEQQKYSSPYSGDNLKVSLFDVYEIDHIIPKSRLFDDSISNKVLVEGFLNKEKSNRTAWEYITQQITHYKIYSIETYLRNINENYFGKKKWYLLLEKIPNNIVERQIRDTQYISIAVKNELAKIVGSNNIKTTTGEVTSFLRSRWGLRKLFMEMTEERFKQMELWDSTKIWVKKYYDKESNKNIYEIAHWSKRYDHRHHAIDALTVALTDQSYIQRLNNLNKELQDWLIQHKEEIKLNFDEGETAIEAFFNLEEKRRIEIQENIESFRKFDPPINNLISKAKEHLEAMVVSYKPKDNLSIQYNDKSKKKEIKIRGALHEATFYGKQNGRDTKTVSISNLKASEISKVVDETLRDELDNHRKKKEYGTMKEAFTGEGLKSFNENRFQRKNPNLLKQPVNKVKIYYSKKENSESTLQRLHEDNDKLSVKTGGNYLFIVMEKEEEKGIERVFDIVSLFDAADIAQKEWENKNENFKQAIYEDSLSRNKADRFLFALQQNDLVYLPFNIEDPLLNFLSNDEFEDWITKKENKKNFNKRIYRVVDMTVIGKKNKYCFFIPNNYANTISIKKELTAKKLEELKNQYIDKKIPKTELNYEEFGSFGKSTKTEVNEKFVQELLSKKKKIELPLIQDTCIKLKLDWLGNIKLAL